MNIKAENLNHTSSYGFLKTFIDIQKQLASNTKKEEKFNERNKLTNEYQILFALLH